MDEITKSGNVGRNATTSNVTGELAAAAVFLVGILLGLAAQLKIYPAGQSTNLGIENVPQKSSAVLTVRPMGSVTELLTTQPSKRSGGAPLAIQLERTSFISVDLNIALLAGMLYIAGLGAGPLPNEECPYEQHHENDGEHEEEWQEFEQRMTKLENGPGP